MMIIDAKDAILGRVGSYAAKQALLGNEVQVVNCEECVVSGRKQPVVENYSRRIDRKAPGKGPYFYRRPDMFVRRMIRGMLPYKRARGRYAFSRIKCHIGVPESLRSGQAIKIEGAGSGKIMSAECIKVKDICRLVGGRT